MKMIKQFGMAALFAAFAAPASAQLASPSAAALGLGDNFTAAARGYSAVAWNPANLGLSGNPGFSLTLGTLRGIAGMDPVTLADLKEYENELVPAAVKQQWLDEIRAEGSQDGYGGGDVTAFAASFGRIGLQLSTSLRARTDLAPGVAELLMFGNADDQGNAKNIALGGSSMDMNAYTTGAVSYAQPFSMGDGAARAAVGVTAKYTIGHVIARGDDSQGSATAQPLGVDFSFPIIHTDFDGASGNSGSGLGLDIGFAYETGIWSLSATAQNVVNTFEWDESKLTFRSGTILFGENTDFTTEFDTASISSAPAGLRQTVADMKFKPSFAAGAMMQASDAMRLTADARFGSAEGMSTRPPTQVGAGVEYRLLSFLPVRLGGAFVKVDEENSGFQYGGGIGLKLGSFNLAASAAQRNTDLGTDTFVMFSIISIGQ